MAYTGSVDLISGIRPKNNGTFPLVDAKDVYVTDDKRLDTALNEKMPAADALPKPEDAGTEGQFLKNGADGATTWGDVTAEEVKVSETQNLDEVLSEKADADDVIPKPAVAGTEGQHLEIDANGDPVWLNPGTPTDTQVGDAVDAWLTAHPEATTTVQDGSITRAKLDADLQEKTDAVPELKSALEEITETIGYQYVQVPNVTKYPDERWYYPTGTGPTESGGTGKTAVEFSCDPLADYDICGKYAGTTEGYPIFIMDASYTILDTIITAEQVTVDGEARHTLFTTPANAAIIRYNVATDAAHDSQRVKVAGIAPKGVPGLEQDVSVLEDRCDNQDNDIAEIKDIVDGITENEIVGYTQIANVTKYPDERWYLNGTGPTSSGATGKTALEFACQPNTAYAICGKYAGTSEGYPIISLDANNNVLDTITDAEQVEYQGVNRFTFFTTPANAAKVRYNVATDASFDQQLKAVYYLAPKGFSTLTPNILAGKKWAALGDSFTAYTNKTFDDGVYKTQDRVYSRLIAERNHMTLLDKFFASGRTLAYPSDGTFTNSVTCPTAACYYQNIPADVDYITIMLGINDEHHYTGGGDGEDPTGVITLGTIDDNTTATYYGAWNVVLSWLITNRPNAHIGIIVTNGLSIPEWRQAQINIAQKYGVAYIDLNGDQITPVMIRTVNSNIADSVKAALISKWAVDPTGAGGTVNTHPNWQAHEYEAAFIEDFLRRI